MKLIWREHTIVAVKAEYTSVQIEEMTTIQNINRLLTCMIYFLILKTKLWLAIDFVRYNIGKRKAIKLQQGR